jgi:hypothetical protein
VITSAERTVRVKDFLKDFEKAIDVLKDRFKPEYAASPEVLALLRRGSDVELRNRRQGLTADSAWAALGLKLGALAHAYEVAWPVEDMNVRTARLNDAELSIRQVEQKAKEVRSRIKDDMPASVEVGQLFTQWGKVKETLARLSLPLTGMPSWREIESGLDALAHAFGLPRP